MRLAFPSPTSGRVGERSEPGWGLARRAPPGAHLAALVARDKNRAALPRLRALSGSIVKQPGARHAPIFRWSHARTANRLPLRLGMLRHARRGWPRELSPDFRWPLRHERFLPFAPSKLREQSAAWRTRDACSIKQATGLEGFFEGGLALRRSTAASYSLGTPLPFPGMSGEVLRDTTLGAVLRRGAHIQGRPGSRLRSRDRRRRSPFTFKFALENAPQRTGMNASYERA